MPRKAAAPAAPTDDSVPTGASAAAADGDSQPARRSSRLAGRDKPQMPKKAPAKPRGRKAKAVADGDDQDGEAEAKPKSGRGKKRTAAENAAEEGAEPEGEEAPAAKKVAFFIKKKYAVQYTDTVVRLNPNPRLRRSLHPRPLQSQPPRQPLQSQLQKLPNLHLVHLLNHSQPPLRNPLQERAPKSPHLR